MTLLLVSNACEFVCLRRNLVCKLVQVIVEQYLSRRLERQLEDEEQERSEFRVLDDDIFVIVDRAEYLDAELDLAGNGSFAEDDQSSCHLLHVQDTVLVDVKHLVHLLKRRFHLDCLVLRHVAIRSLHQGSHFLHEGLLVNHARIAILVETHLGSDKGDVLEASILSQLHDVFDVLLFLDEALAPFLGVLEFLLGKLGLAWRGSSLESFQLFVVVEVLSRDPLDELLVVDVASCWHFQV